MNIGVEGKVIKLYNPGYTTIENEIFWKGLEGWEKTSVELWKKLVNHSECILDVGANSGLYSILASALNPKAQIYAFEPVQRTAVLFQRNLELNLKTNIKLIKKAVSNANGNFTFYDTSSQSQYSASLNQKMLEDDENRVTYQIEAIRLDSMSELSTYNVGLIKLDVEMHEPEALEGMIDIINRNHPTILIEVLNNEIATKVNNLLSNVNYLCFSIDELNKPKLLKKISPSEFHNLLLIKEENLWQVNLSKTDYI